VFVSIPAQIKKTKIVTKTEKIIVEGNEFERIIKEEILVHDWKPFIPERKKDAWGYFYNFKLEKQINLTYNIYIYEKRIELLNENGE